MLSGIRPLFLVIFLMSVLTGCGAPPPVVVATIEPPTSTSLPPTEAIPVATATLGISGVQVSIPVVEDNESFNATVTGNGEIGVILADTFGYNPLRWLPLIDALYSNERLRMVTFAYRDEDATPNQDTRAVFDYLQAEGIDKIICVGAGYGSNACGYLQNEPEIIGMVLIVTDTPVIDANFPKLFLTADADPLGLASSTERVYNQSAEPKVFKTYPAGVHGTALFSKEDVGPQVLADIADFINEIVPGQ